jgi:hypothetical protein
VTGMTRADVRAFPAARVMLGKAQLPHVPALEEETSAGHPLGQWVGVGPISERLFQNNRHPP